MKYKYIFFDVADTLLYKQNLYINIQKTLLSYDINIDIKTIKEKHTFLSETITFPDKTSKIFYDYFNTEFLYVLGIIPTKEINDSIYQNVRYLSWEKFNDVEYIKQLHLPMGIISNWDESLSSKLEDYIGSSFSNIISSNILGISKPNVGIYREAIKQVGYKSSEILYVGNSIKLDIVPALEVGLRPILIDRDNIFSSFNSEKISSLRELSEILDKT